MHRNDKILIIGNGPSARELADIGFHRLRADVDTFGMGIAYRYYREINWWPRWYALGDSKVVFSHRQALAELVEDPAVTTERFFLSWPVTEHLRLEVVKHSSTGDLCFRKSLELGYREIYLIGIEGQYVEEILESRPLTDNEYYSLGFDQLGLKDSLRVTLRIITETPDDNPNYFFHGYQAAGDVYSLPQSGVHRRRWNMSAQLADAGNIRALNLSPGSKVNEFPKSTLTFNADRLLQGDSPQSASDTNVTGDYWFGPFERADEMHIDESEVLLGLLSNESERDAGIEATDFLKVDADEFDRMMSKESDLTTIPAPVVLTGFGNQNGEPQGYSMAEKAAYLEARGYAVYVSEWHPVAGDGLENEWYAFKRHPCELASADSWGKLLAFRKDPGIWAIVAAIQSIKERESEDSPVENQTMRPAKPEEAARNDRFPLASRITGIVRRVTAAAWRRRRWVVPASLLLVLIAATGFAPGLAEYQGMIWGAEAFAIAMAAVLYLALRMNIFVVRLRSDIAKSRRTNAKALDDVRAAHVQALEKVLRETTESMAVLETRLETRLGAVEGRLKEASRSLSVLESTLEKDRKRMNAIVAEADRLRERTAAGERQLGQLLYPDAPRSIVFFGHHKCGSRLFRNDVFARVAEMLDARIRRYEIAEPPFHYSQTDDLDLSNMDLSALGQTAPDVVLFANATRRSLDAINAATSDWKGIRVLRDPRQILVSSYIHHKTDHPIEGALGWVWDKLVHDKPILARLPQEEGLLYELDNITREVIETQLLAPFDDDRVLTIKLEDFARDSHKELRRISEFLEIPDIAGIDLTNTRAHPDSVPWQDYFTPTLKEVFKERYGEALIALGYAEDMSW